ncbi:MAG: right-handed parallel beta-helix repeat-containing protein [Candidatus Rokuibacteriota bacterium]
MLTCTFYKALVFLLILITGAPAAGAAVLTLDVCTPEALRALMAGAVDGDVLLLPACTITVTGAAGDDANVSGDFDIATSITLQGVGPDATILDGGGLERVLDIRPGAAVVVADLTVRNGAVPGTESGGGIRNEEVLTLLNVLVTGNTAGGGGGGIGCTFVTKTLGVRGSRITGNSAGGLGGGIGSDTGCDVLVAASSIVGNRAGGGGGIAVLSRAITVRDSTVADNTAAGSGGGIDVGFGGDLTVERSTVSGNAAGASGGGLRLNDSVDGTLHNTTVAYNRSHGDGGGIDLTIGDETLTLVHSTIARNTDAGNAASGAGGVAKPGGILNVPQQRHRREHGRARDPGGQRGRRRDDLE